MNRPRQIWFVFALCAAVLVAAMGWITFTVVRLDGVQQKAEREALIEERVRLALWRMDSALALLLAEENARPWTAFEAFHPAERAYTKANAAYGWGEVLVPSPLLAFRSTNVLLHFQFGPDGRLTSPQNPPAVRRALAEEGGVPPALFDAAAQKLAALQGLMDQAVAAESGRVSMSRAAGGSYGAGTKTDSSRYLFEQKSRDQNRDSVVAQATEALQEFEKAADAPAAPEPSGVPALESRLEQVQRKDNEEQARNQLFNNSQLASRAGANQVGPQSPARPPADTGKSAVMLADKKREEAEKSDEREQVLTAFELPDGKTPTSVGPLAATWIGSELVLTRRVNFDGDYRIQGCWLNWPSVHRALLASVHDLLPGADVVPQPGARVSREGRHLVSLPVELVTGRVEVPAAADWTPVRITLALAWLGALLAAAAVGLLLHGAVSLSERRAAFVSAVTHELRTPLTTFKMYSEMLADDMVTDETRRKGYLATLCSEANRLSHLVENVLAYARLERGSARSRVEQITVADLLTRVRDRLAQRAEQAGLTLVTDAGEAAATLVHVDPGAVEQILFNLVDNACKYAAPTATSRSLSVDAREAGARFVDLRVLDHGPGITVTDAGRLFQPFSKSAHEAAHSAPGVGLGLALCRRLSRSMGGDLRLDSTRREGACFVLRLPVADGKATHSGEASIA